MGMTIKEIEKKLDEHYSMISKLAEIQTELLTQVKKLAIVVNNINTHLKNHINAVDN